MGERHLTLIRELDLKLGDRVKLIRKAAGMNQTEMAAHLGCSQGSVSKIEAYELEVRLHQLGLLRTVFEISADAFLDGSVDYDDIAYRFANRKFSLEKELAKLKKVTESETEAGSDVEKAA